MLRFNGQTTLISQLLRSIDYHLKIIHLPMEQQTTSIDDDDDEIWLSDHRSIFSSDESSCQKTSFCPSQYEGFHWDLYENRNYHHLAFEHDNKQTDSLSDWSMDLNSEDISDRPRTCWQEIKNKSLSHSRSSSTNTSSPSDHHHISSNRLTLYNIFQRTKSHQHPCRLYENFSDESTYNSLTSSSSSSLYTDTSKFNPMPRIKLKSPTTFSQIKLNYEQSKIGIDQCQQTSLIDPFLKSVDRLSNNPSQSSSSATRQSLPNLDFLTYYAIENPTSLSTRKKSLCTVMKTPLFQPLTGIRTVFYCTIDNSSNRPIIFHSSQSKSHVLKETKRIKTSPMTNLPEETETFSSICSSSSSSGYFSNSSRHTQTPSSPYPLKSCLKRTKIDDESNSLHSTDETSKYRRYSAPTTSTKTSADRTSSNNNNNNNNTCTLSEHDLRAKKSVSFCHEIARRLITPSVHLREQDDFCNLIPGENFLDSPPNEFNLFDDEHDHENQIINFIEDQTHRPLLIKYDNDQKLIQTFSKTILRILEIRCNDPKSFYLNNQTNLELDRTLRNEFCPLLREILEDGLRENSNILFSKKIDLWKLIELTTPTTTGRLHDAKIKSQIGLSTTIDSIDKFNSFIYQLLNFHQLTTWLTHFLSQRRILHTYYEFSAFVLINNNNDLVENISNQLEKLSPLSFRLKYFIIPLTNQQRSILSKKFQVRTWLRDRKSQMKISSNESPVPPHVTIRRKFNSIPVTKRT